MKLARGNWQEGDQKNLRENIDIGMEAVSRMRWHLLITHKSNHPSRHQNENVMPWGLPFTEIAAAWILGWDHILNPTVRGCCGRRFMSPPPRKNGPP